MPDDNFNDEVTVQISDAKKQILAEITKSRKEFGEGVAQNKEAIEDMKKVLKEVQEKTAKAKAPEQETGSEVMLKRFAKEDGGLIAQARYSKTDKGLKQVSEAGLFDTDATYGEWHAEVKQVWSDMALLRMITDESGCPKTEQKLMKLLDLCPSPVLASAIKAQYNGEGVGGELVPDQFVSIIHQPIYSDRVARSLFASERAPKGSWTQPRIVRGGRPRRKGVVRNNVPARRKASTIKMDDKQSKLKPFGDHYVIDEHLPEDSAIAFLPVLRGQMLRDHSASIEDCMFNGDTQAQHQDAIEEWNTRGLWDDPADPVGDLGGDDDHRTMWDGFRRRAFARQSAIDISAGTTEALLSLYGLMGLAGNPRGAIMFTSLEDLIGTFLGLDEVITVDKLGNLATIVTGQLASFFGSPLVVTDMLTKDLDANGKFVGSGNSKGGVSVVRRNSFKFWTDRGIVIEQDKDIKVGAYDVVSTERVLMDTMDADSVKNCAYGFNL